jgi:hypothetical protein
MNYHIFGILCNSYGSVVESIRDIKGSCKPAPARHCKSWYPQDLNPPKSTKEQNKKPIQRDFTMLLQILQKIEQNYWRLQ